MITIGKMKIHNLGPFENVTYEWDKFSGLITGYNQTNGMHRNGTGKSMLPDILTWIIWEENVRGISKSAIVRSGLSMGYGTVFIHKDGRTYLIKRTRGKSSTLQFWEVIGDKKHNLTKQKITLTQQAINGHLGLTYDTFVNISYFGQGAGNKFLEGTPKTREEVIINFFNIRLINDAITKAKMLIRMDGDEIKSVSNKIFAWNETIADIDVDEMSKEKKEVHKHIDEYKRKINDAEKRIAAMELLMTLVENFMQRELEYKNKLTIMKLDVDGLKEKLEDTKDIVSNINVESLKSKIKSREKAENDVEELIQQVNETEEQIKALQKKYRTSYAKYTTSKDNYERLTDMRVSGDDCPQCGAPMDAAQKERIGKDIKQFKGNMRGWGSKCDSLKEKIADLEEYKEGLDSKYTEKINFMADKGVLENQLEDAYEARRNVKGIKDKLKTKVEEKKRFVAVNKKVIKQIYDEITQSIKGDEELEALELNIKTLRELIKSYEQTKSHNISTMNGYKVKANEFKTKLRLLRSTERKIAESEKDIEESRVNILINEYLLQTFVDVKYNYLDNINHTLEDAINTKLTELGIDIKVELLTEVERKSDDVKIDKYEIIIHDGDKGGRDFKTYSGGEKQRIAVAVYLAFYELAKNKSVELNLLIFDEIFMYFDDVGTEACLDIIHGLKSKKNVVVISHDESVISSFKTNERVTVVKSSDGVSTIRK